MPVEVKIGDQIRRVEMAENRGQFKLATGIEFEIDPRKWLLMGETRSVE